MLDQPKGDGSVQGAAEIVQRALLRQTAQMGKGKNCLTLQERQGLES
jgi:hypothetical protein